MEKEARKPRLQLSTQLQEPATVEIDGSIFEIYGAEHISKEQEIELIAHFKKYERLERELDNANSEGEIKKAAQGLQGLRTELIENFTNIPEDVIGKLRLPAQVGLLNIIAKEMGLEAPAPDGDQQS